MKEKFKGMTLKEFSRYCNDRAADGQWSLEEALFCCNKLSKIYKIKVKRFGIIPSKKLTEQAQEEAWQELLNK